MTITWRSTEGMVPRPGSSFGSLVVGFCRVLELLNHFGRLMPSLAIEPDRQWSRASLLATRSLGSRPVP
jgi:hypothetical protein